MTVENRSDDVLMGAYVGGDTSAFDELFQRHRRHLFTLLLHQTGCRAVAEDLFQEVFLKLIRNRSKFTPSRAFRSWLFTIAHNALTDHRRRASLRQTEESDMSTFSDTGTFRDEAAPAETSCVTDPATDPVGAAHARELGRQIEAALCKLPDEQREVFVMRERAGLDFQRIAEVTGANLSTVKSRMRYALAGLRSLLSSELASLPELSHE